MPPARPLRSTVVVADGLAFAHARREAARAGAIGRQILTLERLVETLAGPFLRVPDVATVRAAVARASAASLGDLASIAPLPGFVRAASAALRLAWDEGLDPRHPPLDVPRWRALAALEGTVAASLPGDVWLPRDVARLATLRAGAAPALLGAVTLLHLDEVPAVWREVLTAVADHVPVTWRRLDDERPDWLPPGIAVEAREPAHPERRRVSCATPAHEALEAVRWARGLLAEGTAEPGDVAIAAAQPSAYDGVLVPAARRAGVPLHAVHGEGLLTRVEGQAAVALADAALRGPSLERVRRAADLLQALRPREGDERLPDGWWARLPPELPLDTPERWRRAAASATWAAPPAATAWLLDLVEGVARGVAGVGELGERFLTGDAATAWRRALHESPADALPAALARLRVGDGREPTTSVLWGPAADVARSPRAFVRILGVTAGGWPRPPTDDPLLPPHVAGVLRPSRRTRPRADRDAFAALLRHTARQVVVSRARRDADGKTLVASPLLTTGALADLAETSRALRDAPVSPLDEGERLAWSPRDRRDDPSVARATAAHRAWRAPTLGPHEGLVRPGHPALRRAMARRHSATSLQRLLRDPLGFTWRYALGWQEPPEDEEPLTLEPRHLGTLVHGVLEAATRALDADGGLVGASAAALERAVDGGVAATAAGLADRITLPPALLWRGALAEARALALAALAHPLDPVPGRSYPEVPFGSARGAGAHADGTWPWDPAEPVSLLGGDLPIGGTIDRLDVAADGSRVRVVDYKTGRLHLPRTRGLAGGAELQRCLYAAAARALLGAEPRVEAYLLYPRAGRAFALDDPDAALERLRSVLASARDALLEGLALPGVDAFSEHAETRFGLPADARRGYDDRTLPLVRDRLPSLAALWDEVPG